VATTAASRGVCWPRSWRTPSSAAASSHRGLPVSFCECKANEQELVDIVACVFDYLLEAQQSFNTQDLKVVVALFDRATRRSAKKKSPAAGGENAGQGVTPAPAAENGEGTSEPCTKLVRQAELAGWQ
jgi:hypothetical protein